MKIKFIIIVLFTLLTTVTFSQYKKKPATLDRAPLKIKKQGLASNTEIIDFLANGQYYEAVEALKAHIETEPDNVSEYYRTLGKTYDLQANAMKSPSVNDFYLAEKNYVKAVERDTSNFKNLYYLGFYYYNRAQACFLVAEELKYDRSWKGKLGYNSETNNGHRYFKKAYPLLFSACEIEPSECDDKILLMPVSLKAAIEEIEKKVGDEDLSTEIDLRSEREKREDEYEEAKAQRKKKENQEKALAEKSKIKKEKNALANLSPKGKEMPIEFCFEDIYPDVSHEWIEANKVFINAIQEDILFNACFEDRQIVVTKCHIYLIMSGFNLPIVYSVNDLNLNNIWYSIDTNWGKTMLSFSIPGSCLKTGEAFYEELASLHLSLRIQRKAEAHERLEKTDGYYIMMTDFKSLDEDKEKNAMLLINLFNKLQNESACTSPPSYKNLYNQFLNVPALSQYKKEVKTYNEYTTERRRENELRRQKEQERERLAQSNKYTFKFTYESANSYELEVTKNGTTCELLLSVDYSNDIGYRITHNTFQSDPCDYSGHLYGSYKDGELYLENGTYRSCNSLKEAILIILDETFNN